MTLNWDNTRAPAALPFFCCRDSGSKLQAHNTIGANIILGSTTRLVPSFVQVAGDAASSYKRRDIPKQARLLSLRNALKSGTIQLNGNKFL